MLFLYDKLRYMGEYFMTKTLKKYAIVLAILMIAVLGLAACTKNDGNKEDTTRAILDTLAKDIPLTASIKVTPTLSTGITDIQWELKSSNEEVIEIGQEGASWIITAKQVGSVDITAVTTIANRAIPSEPVTLNIFEPTETTPVLVVSGYDNSIEVEDKVTLRTEVKNAGSAAVSYKSLNTDVATVDNNGDLNVIKEGTVKIAAYSTIDNITYVGYTDEIKVTPLPERIDVEGAKPAILERGEIDLDTVVFPETARQSVEFKSNNPKVATVDTDGKVKAISQGTATITVQTLGGKTTKDITVQVKPIVELSNTVTGNESTIVVDANDTAELQVQQRVSVDSANEFATDSKFVYTIDSGAEFVEFDEATGKVIAKETTTEASMEKVVVRATLDTRLDTREDSIEELDPNAPFSTTTINVVRTPKANEFYSTNKDLLKNQDLVAEMASINNGTLFDRANPDATVEAYSNFERVLNNYFESLRLSQNEAFARFNLNYLGLKVRLSSLYEGVFTDSFIEFYDENGVQNHDDFTEYDSLNNATKSLLGFFNEGGDPTISQVNALLARLEVLEKSVDGLITKTDAFVEEYTKISNQAATVVEYQFMQSRLKRLHVVVDGWVNPQGEDEGLTRIRKTLEFLSSVAIPSVAA